MADPLTLGAVGLVALKEGIKFLYTQAGEVIKYWRERKDAKGSEDGQKLERISASLPNDAFDGQLNTVEISVGALNSAARELSRMRQDLTPYVDGLEEIERDNPELLARADSLRNLLEAVYRQRITFKGESRPSSGTVVDAMIDVEKVAGDAAALRAKEVTSGVVLARARAKTVEAGGKLTGAEIDRITSK
jgi:hypothetical protein